MYLSKSDFKVARTCPSKLYYKKLKYPSLFDEDEYLQFLADGGYMVETIAKLLHPGGREIGFERGSEAAFQETMLALKAENVTLFEATVISGQKLARIDILQKRGDRLDLIEVKAKSVDSSEDRNPFRGQKGGIKTDWRPYLEDVAYQTLVLREMMPGCRVIPYLRLVDKAKSTTLDCIFRLFDLRRRDVPGQLFNRPEVRFTGDIDKLRSDHFLTTLDVSQEVEEILPEIVPAIETFCQSLQGQNPKKIPSGIGVQCRSCEYPIEGETSGFRECWGSLADESPHILDYYYASDIGGHNTPLISALVAKGRARLEDVEESDLVKADGSVGSRAQRQRLQRRYTLANQEYFGPNLADLNKHPYPLHFIDFETSRIAVPYHAGMRPYEQVAFQWSCHTIKEPAGGIEHAEWINVVDAYPNFEFGRSLRETIGNHGKIYTWSHHEKSVLKDIADQMIHYRISDPALAQWLDSTASEREKGGRMVDLCKVALSDYFHPLMKGRVSIKAVLPAVWKESAEAIRNDPLFARYYRLGADGKPLSPYETLEPLPFKNEGGEEEDEVVAEGTAAIRAYQEMLYGVSRNDTAQCGNCWRKLLLQYCQLDTAAMVIIWMHWRNGVNRPR